MIENNGNVPLQLDWLLWRNSVSKSAVLLTEWVFESDLVSKMADLLTEKDIRCATTGLLRKHCVSEGATTTPSRLASRGRECPRRGLGGFVGFLQLADRPSECNGGRLDRPAQRERAAYQGNCRKSDETTEPPSRTLTPATC